MTAHGRGFRRRGSTAAGQPDVLPRANQRRIGGGSAADRQRIGSDRQRLYHEPVRRPDREPARVLAPARVRVPERVRAPAAGVTGRRPGEQSWQERGVA